ncbi:glycosyltransferase family 39 protein, partial [bacterium]|nr:glycosyltransferase family 39 protein [bacterium]
MSKKNNKNKQVIKLKPVDDKKLSPPKKSFVSWHIFFLFLILVTGFSLRYSYITGDTRTKINHFPKGVGIGDEQFLGYDGVRYDWIASNVYFGRGYGYKPNKPDGWRPPGYPFFLTAVYFFAGKNYFAVKFLQVLLSTFTILLIYLITNKAAGKKTALVSSLICALYYDAVIFPLLYYSETLFGFLTALILYLLLFFNRFDTKPFFIRYAFMFILGLISAYAVLVRPIFLPMLPFILLGLGWDNKFSKLFFKKILFYLLTVVIVLMPWSVRNSKLYKRPAFISNNGGFNFSMGFCENANGYFLPERKRFTEKEKQIMKNKNAFAIGKTFVKEHPMRALELFLKKIQIQLFCRSSRKFVVFFKENPVPMLCYTPIILLLFIGGMIAGLFYKRKKLIIFYCFIT